MHFSQLFLGWPASCCCCHFVCSHWIKDKCMQSPLQACKDLDFRCQINMHYMPMQRYIPTPLPSTTLLCMHTNNNNKKKQTRSIVGKMPQDVGMVWKPILFGWFLRVLSPCISLFSSRKLFGDLYITSSHCHAQYWRLVHVRVRQRYIYRWHMMYNTDGWHIMMV